MGLWWSEVQILSPRLNVRREAWLSNGFSPCFVLSSQKYYHTITRIGRKTGSKTQTEVKGSSQRKKDKSETTIAHNRHRHQHGQKVFQMDKSADKFYEQKAVFETSKNHSLCSRCHKLSYLCTGVILGRSICLVVDWKCSCDNSLGWKLYFS